MAPTTNGHNGVHHATDEAIDHLYSWMPPQPAPAPLPEARASVNVRLVVGGREVLWTLRDDEEGRLAARLERLLAQYPLEASQAPAPTQGQDWCRLHNTALHLNHGKDGRTWKSHKTAEGWCKGR